MMLKEGDVMRDSDEKFCFSKTDVEVGGTI